MNAFETTLQVRFGRVGFPLVHSDVDFDHPLRLGDRPQVLVTCFKVGRRLARAPLSDP